MNRSILLCISVAALLMALSCARSPESYPCFTDGDCADGLVCFEEQCIGPGEGCEAPSDCPLGWSCDLGFC